MVDLRRKAQHTSPVVDIAEHSMPETGIVFGQPGTPISRRAVAAMCQVHIHVIDSGCVVISAIGEFDLGTNDELLATLEEQPWHVARAIVVNLTNATFCDARVAGALIALADRANHEELPIHLVANSPIVHRCFTALGVTSALPTHTDVVAAMTAAACRRAV